MSRTGVFQALGQELLIQLKGLWVCTSETPEGSLGEGAFGRNGEARLS